MPTYATFADLLSSNNRQPFATVLVLGAGAIGDGGGGIFYWNAASTETANAETILAVPGIPIGRWILIIGNALPATTEKGDMIVNNGNGLTRLSKPSTNNQVLSSDVNGTLGVAWKAIPAVEGLSVKEGTSDARMGVVQLVGGTATVNTTAVAANSRIFLQAQTGVGPHALHVSSRVVGVSFTITSNSGADTSNIAWLIVEPAA